MVVVDTSDDTPSRLFCLYAPSDPEVITCTHVQFEACETPDVPSCARATVHDCPAPAPPGAVVTSMISVGSAGSRMRNTVGGLGVVLATGKALVAVTVNAVSDPVVPPEVTVPVGWLVKTSATATG